MDTDADICLARRRKCLITSYIATCDWQSSSSTRHCRKRTRFAGYPSAISAFCKACIWRAYSTYRQIRWRGKDLADSWTSLSESKLWGKTKTNELDHSERSGECRSDRPYNKTCTTPTVRKTHASSMGSGSKYTHRRSVAWRPSYITRDEPDQGSKYYSPALEI